MAKKSTSSAATKAKDNHVTQAASAEAVAGADPLQAGNLFKVRDILFGSQLREIERRFTQLEERVKQASADHRAELQRATGALETRIGREVDNLQDTLKTNDRERRDADADLARDLQDLARKTESRAAALEDSLTRASRELRDLITESGNEIGEDVRHRMGELGTQLDNSVSELRDEKADRSAIAELLMDVAMRLNSPAGTGLAGVDDLALQLESSDDGSNATQPSP